MKRRLSAIVLLIVLIVAGLVGYSYSQFRVYIQRVDSVSPSLKTDLGSIAEGITNLVTGNFTDSVTSVLDGISIATVVKVHNGGIIPVYLPGMKHVIFMGEGHEAAETTETNPATWLGPGETKLVNIDAFIPIEEIPEMALAAIVNGGVIDFTVESTVDLPGFTIARRADGTSDVLEPLRERIDTLEECLGLD